MSWTRDTPAAGLVVWQPRHGFRYGSEAFWLVGFALEGGVPATALDLGTGSGIAALLLAARGVAVTGIDVRPEWAEGWIRSTGESRPAVPPRFEVADVRGWSGPPVDLVVSNPPYFAASTGPRAALPWKAAARTEAGATLADFVAAATRHGRRACFVVPIDRAAEVVAPGWRVVRRVSVGRVRALVEIAPGGGPPGEDTGVGEGDPRVSGWYDRARGVENPFRPGDARG